MDQPQTRIADTRPVSLWLFGICAMIFVMVVLGGTTRLTGSGLSIMEWHPVTGILPPLSHQAWENLFALYRQIPQYHLLHDGMSLDGFKHIFWLEYFHRLWGRLMGLVFLLPFLWFAAMRRLPSGLWKWLAVFFILGGLQGGIGWFMVASGFMAGSIAVEAWRLVLHLSCALVLYTAILWTALSLWQPVPRRTARGLATRRLALALVGLVPLTIVAGGFMAGLHAGLTYNTFPLMDGRVFPKGYFAVPLPRGWFENITAVQFDHRLLATLTALIALATVITGFAQGPRQARPVLAALAGIVGLQYLLGVLTLLYRVPVPVAAAHQACAVLLLTVAIVLVHDLRGAGQRAALATAMPAHANPAGA